MSEAPITISFALNWRDYYSANKIWLRQTRYLKHITWVVVLFIIACALVGIWANGSFESCFDPEESYSNRALWFVQDNVISLLLLVFAVLYATGWVRKIAFWQYFRRSKLAGIVRTWVFTHESAKCSFDQAESVLKWDYFGRWSQGENHIVLIAERERRLYYPFPKCAFTNQADLEKFTALLKEKIPQDKK